MPGHPGLSTFSHCVCVCVCALGPLSYHLWSFYYDSENSERAGERKKGENLIMPSTINLFAVIVPRQEQNICRSRPGRESGSGSFRLMAFGLFGLK